MESSGSASFISLMVLFATAGGISLVFCIPGDDQSHIAPSAGSQYGDDAKADLGSIQSTEDDTKFEEIMAPGNIQGTGDTYMPIDLLQFVSKFIHPKPPHHVQEHENKTALIPTLKKKTFHEKLAKDETRFDRYMQRKKLMKERRANATAIRKMKNKMKNNTNNSSSSNSAKQILQIQNSTEVVSKTNQEKGRTLQVEPEPESKNSPITTSTTASTTTTNSNGNFSQESLSTEILAFNKSASGAVN